MTIYIDKYLEEFDIFTAVKKILDKYDLDNPPEISSDEELNSRKLYKEWVDVADTIGSGSWGKEEWSNFLTNMALAVATKPAIKSVEYALAALQLELGNTSGTSTRSEVTMDSNGKLTIHLKLLKEPIIESLSRVLVNAVKTLLLVSNPEFDISADNVMIDTDQIDLISKNYINISASKLIFAYQSNEISSDITDANVSNSAVLYGDSIISAYKGSMDTRGKENNRYIYKDYYLYPVNNDCYIDVVEINILNIYNINNINEMDDDSKKELNSQLLDSLLKDADNSPRILYDRYTNKLWVMIESYSSSNSIYCPFPETDTYKYRSIPYAEVNINVKSSSNADHNYTKTIKIYYKSNDYISVNYSPDDPSIYSDFGVGYNG